MVQLDSQLGRLYVCQKSRFGKQLHQYCNHHHGHENSEFCKSVDVYNLLQQTRIYTYIISNSIGQNKNLIYHQWKH